MTSYILKKAIDRRERELEHAKKMEERGIQEETPLKLLDENIKGAVNLCKDREIDYPLMVAGGEGVGKSTLASHVVKKIAKYTNQEIDLSESMIYSYDERDKYGHPLINSFLGFTHKYQNTHYKILWYDEAVSVLFSDDHATRESKDAKKLFVIKREMRHFDVLIAPSFFQIVKDIRERRIKALLYCYIEKNRETGKFEHWYAWFSSQKIVQLSLSPKARAAFRSPKSLFRIVQPDFVEKFPEMDKDFRETYLLNKHTFRSSFIDSLIGNNKTAADYLLPENIDLTPAFDKLLGRKQTGELAT